MNRKIKIITLGAATQDVFLTGKALTAKRDVRTHEYVEILPLGAKLELEGAVFATGGGATNAAVTFARLGFETRFMGKIGDDIPGREIIKSLTNEGIDCSLIACDTKDSSGYSTLLVAPTGERTVLVYRGASENMKTKDFKWKQLRADWLYVTSLAGNLPLLEHALKIANHQGIQVALDPGSKELAQNGKLKKLLPYLRVLKTNKEEMAKIFRKKSIKELLQTASRYCRFIIITDGARGSYATDGEYIYHSGTYKDVKVIDRTGAGDAFGSGVVAMLAQGHSLEKALSFGSANSTSVVRYLGAKQGIMRHDRIKPMPIKITKL